MAFKRPFTGGSIKYYTVAVVSCIILGRFGGFWFCHQRLYNKNWQGRQLFPMLTMTPLAFHQKFPTSTSLQVLLHKKWTHSSEIIVKHLTLWLNCSPDSQILILKNTKLGQGQKSIRKSPENNGQHLKPHKMWACPPFYESACKPVVLSVFSAERTVGKWLAF